MTTIPPYPLAWPEEHPRSARREKSQFRTQLPAALKNVTDSLRLFAQDSGRKLTGAQITSNVGLLDNRPADPGIAVWFEWDGALRCIAVDRYPTVAENLQAVHHVLEARRTEMRHAGIEMTRAAFRGFIAAPPALPAPERARPWWEVLGVSRDASADDVQAAYKGRARDYASRGDQASLAELNVARDAAVKERGA